MRACRAGKVRAGKVRAGKVRAGKVRAAGALAAALLAPRLAVAQAAPPARPSAVGPGVPAAPARPRHTAADVAFVRDMIGHHAQALTMAALVPARAADPALRALAERIAVSQRDEIDMMRRWLADRGEAPPDGAGAHDASGHGAAPHDPSPHDSSHHAQNAPPRDAAHHAGAGAAHAAMPGMLAPAELARLGAARGAAFDRLFLAGMVRHHEGALAMVARLFATPGAAQEPETFGLASEVDADQRAEIARMRALLRAPPPRTAPTPRPRR